jgi:hypothetical protein
LLSRDVGWTGIEEIRGIIGLTRSLIPVACDAIRATAHFSAIKISSVRLNVEQNQLVSRDTRANPGVRTQGCSSLYRDGLCAAHLARVAARYRTSMRGLQFLSVSDLEKTDY